MYQATLKTIMDRIENNESEGLLGKVLCSPPLRTHPRRPGYLHDWALVELDPDQFPSPENKVRVGMLKIPPSLDGRTLPPAQHDILKYMEYIGHIAVSGVRACRRAGLRESFQVCKRGGATGLTHGVVSEIEAVLRQPRAGAGQQDALVSWSMLIVGTTAHKGSAFAVRGDSGSCIIDHTGKAVAMIDAVLEAPKATEDPRHLTSGIRYEEGADLPQNDAARVAPVYRDVAQPPRLEVQFPLSSFDIIFATPMEWIFDNMREVTKMEPVVV
jgi:hypothetical protein